MTIALLAVACGDSGETSEGTGPDALAEAVASGDTGAVEQALSAGADPDAAPDGRPLLATAAARDHASVVAALAAAGAEIDRTGPEGITALHAAAQTGAVAAIEALLAAGADDELRSANGMAALDHAAALGRAEAIAALVAAGSDPDRPSGAITQGHGMPRDTAPAPLAIAARAGHLDAVETLLVVGADVDRTSEAGVTALHAAVFGAAAPEVVEALLAAGADPALAVGCTAGCSVPGELTAAAWARQLERTDLVAVIPTG